MVSWAEYGKYASFWDLEAPHVDGDMTGFVCRKQVVLLLVDFAKRAFWRHPRDIQEASERHSIGIFSFIWRQKLRKRRVSWCFFTIKAFFLWNERKERAFFEQKRVVCLDLSVNEIVTTCLLCFSRLSRKRLPMALKVGRMVVFTALATAARQVLACRRSLSTPQSYAFSLGSLRFPSVFSR